MGYVFLVIVILVLMIIIFNKNEQIASIKQQNKELEKSNEDFKKVITKDEEMVINLKLEVDNLKADLLSATEELKVYTEIKNDSMNLNIVEDDNSNKNIVKDLEEDAVGENSAAKEGIVEEINSEKADIYKLMENTNRNLFITGKAGTGKSYLLKYFRKKTRKSVLYTAPTGIAALNIGGVTLHSTFGFNNLIDERDITLSFNKKDLLKRIDTLIIDEISMVRVDVFTQIDKILKKANGNELPFGGKQVILFGDLFQLPPVAKRDEAAYLTDKYGDIFFFNSPAYDIGNFIFKELKEIFRQTDKSFISILNNIREGKIFENDVTSLNEHYTLEVPRRVVQIVPTKEEASSINVKNLNSLNSKEFIYKANVLIGDNTFKETDFPCDFSLKLKVGSLVMMIANDRENKRWVNGTLGIISDLTPGMVKVSINGTDYEISPIPFNKYKCDYNRETGKIEYTVESSVSQFPLILAYAITIHKSQGMTYQQIAVNLDNCFAPGQAYVALSRCANYDKLYLVNKVDPSCVITNNAVVNFYKACSKKIENFNENYASLNED